MPTKTILQTLVTACSALTAPACDDIRENDNSGCDSGRDLEAVVVSITPSTEGTGDAPMSVRVVLTKSAESYGWQHHRSRPRARRAVERCYRGVCVVESVHGGRSRA